MRGSIAWLMLGLALPLALAADKKEGKEYTSKEHGFTIKMPPGEVKVANLKIGDIAMTNYGVEIDKNTAYMVSVGDFPSGTVKEGSEEKILDGSRDGIVNQLKGKVLEEKKIQLDGKYLGRELRVEAPGIGEATDDNPTPVGLCRCRLFLVGDRLYQIVVVAAEKVANSAETTAFLESFKLTR